MVGLFLWALGGGMISMGCFQPIASVEAVQANKELAIAVSGALSAIMFKTILIWAVMGGIFGLVCFQLWISRPEQEHRTRTPRHPAMRGMPSSGPNTMAEIIAGFQSWFLGAIINVCGVIFICPLLQNELVVVKHGSTILIFAALLTIPTVVPIIPFSIKKIQKSLLRG
jgi:hypothetical protein